MGQCLNGTAIPTNNTPIECEEYFNSDCIIYQNAITYLNLPPNSNMTTIVNALVLSLIDARNRIINLENQ